MLTASGLKQAQGAKELLAIGIQILMLSGSSRFLCKQVIGQVTEANPTLDTARCGCSATVMALDS